jgi:tRNA(Ile)-lysidine synthase
MESTSIITTVNKHITDVITNLKKHPPTIILGLSGGPDSVFLFHCLLPLHKQNTISLITAHLDHGWRKESAVDAQFCADLCKKHNIPFVLKHAKNYAAQIKWNGSQEEVGRKLRRLFFKELLEVYHADTVALAHHVQDQQETFFMRLIRGATLQGLTGMKLKDGHYLRPLLNVNKNDIIEYLEKHTIAYRSDPTNNNDNHLRNRIRKYVLPALKASDERFSKKFTDTLAHLQQEETFLQTLTQEAFDDVFQQKNTLFVGNLITFNKLAPVLQKRLIVFWLTKLETPFPASNAFLKEILRFLATNRGGHHAVTSHLTVYKQGKIFWAQTK